MSAADHDKKTPSRREFLVGVAGGAIGGFVAGQALSPNDELKWSTAADVVVVGGGASGCATALSASEAGAKVLLLEAAPVLGGAGSLCIGSISLPLSSLQKQQGIDDNVDDYIEDVMHRAGREASRMDLELLRLLATNGGATIDWLLGLGVDIQGPFEYPAHRVNRMHMLIPKSAQWPKVVRPLLEQKNVEVRLATKGLQLHQDPKRRVIGVRAVDTVTGHVSDIRARKAVVLTAGSVDANPAWKSKVTTPDVASLQPAMYSRDGSGLTMASAIGAAMTMLDGMSNPQLRGMPPGPGVFSIGKQDWMPYGMVDAGAILVNKQGRRFADETVTGAPLSVALERQPFATGYMIFDSRVAEIFNRWPMVVCSLPGIGEVSKLGGWGLVDDVIARRGMTRADTLQELANAVGVDPAGLALGVQKWNACCKSGADPEFHRPTFGHPQARTVGAGIQVPPFYCHSPLRTIDMPSDTSLLINTRQQVIDVYGRVIPSLYAGGDMGHGNLILKGTGHGINMGWAFTSGRLGGRSAAGEESQG